MKSFKNDDEIVENFVKKIILPDFINSLVSEGIISKTDIHDKKIVSSKIRKYVTKHGDDLKFVFVTDHRDSLLEIAEREVKNNRFEVAISLYATFVEHTLNRIIHLACVSKKIDHKTQTEIIRNTNIIGKCTWLLTLLNLPALRKEYIATILLIAEQRNSYMHYKWKPEIDLEKIPDNDALEKDEQTKNKKIKLLLKYLRTYEARLEFKGNKKRIVGIYK